MYTDIHQSRTQNETNTARKLNTGLTTVYKTVLTCIILSCHSFAYWDVKCPVS